MYFWDRLIHELALSILIVRPFQEINVSQVTDTLIRVRRLADTALKLGPVSNEVEISSVPRIALRSHLTSGYNAWNRVCIAKGIAP